MALFDWLHAPDNPYFARSFVNRVWGHYFGVGLVDPVDNFSLANPPSNDKLLDALARDFVAHHYDIRHLERRSSTRGPTSSRPRRTTTNKLDRKNYSHSCVRPMMAEVVVDVLNTRPGSDREPSATDGPPDARAIEIGSSAGAKRQPGIRLPRLRPAGP